MNLYKMENNPLVSVIVLTYNSSATVDETLDSIKNQSYPNIELIVTDDCSKDDTVSVVRNWLAKNSDRFVNSELVIATVNTGVSGNLNRGVAKSHGTWVKPIAGDDMLLPECVSDNIDCYKRNNETQAVFSRAHFFGDPIVCNQYKNFGYGIFDLKNREKYLFLLKQNCILAPATFISRQYIDSVGGYNEEIPFIEDWPFWIKMFKGKCNVTFLNKETVKYRMGTSLSLGNGGGSKFKESYKLILSYAYKCQMEENPIYRMYAFLLKKQREKESLIISLLLRINIYYYYYRYIEMKMIRASRKYNKQFYG